MVMVDTLRVAVVADLLEERWPSMDLMAEMLMLHVAQSPALAPTLLRPTFGWPVRGGTSGAEAPPTIQRIAHRFWSYPRWLRRQPEADVYHIVDHSYAHLAQELPGGRVVVTCHDTDAFQALLPRRTSNDPAAARASGLPRWLVNRIAGGLQRAAVVVCDSEATRSELVDAGLAAEPRTMVVPIGAHPECSPQPKSDADAAAASLTGASGASDLLHVGSTIPRKRIDVLLDIVAMVAKSRPDVRLWRVGGVFTSEQARRARELGIEDRIVVLPFVTRPVLGALYRRASLVLLPSEREGFGLPVIESMACGTPIVCSELPVLREVGGDAAEYCPVAHPDAWARRVVELLGERDRDRERWRVRQAAAVARAAAFSWQRHAETMERVYLRVAEAREADR